MNRAVFDTNILIDFSYSNPGAQDIIKRCEMRYISIVTWVEFLTGVPEDRLPQSREFLENVFEIIYPEEAIYEKTLALRRERRLKFPDAMIYATAQEMSAPLITRNTKDFDEAASDIYIPYK